jgi:hypothetical protein
MATGVVNVFVVIFPLTAFLVGKAARASLASISASAGGAISIQRRGVMARRGICVVWDALFNYHLL